MAKYLVTGGAGFIGSNIVRRLVADGEKVVVLDNLSTGKKDNLAEVASDVTFLEGDIRDRAFLDKAMRGADYVLHQAALRAVERSVEAPLETNDVNVTGTLQVLLAAKAAGVKRVVLASSSSVYGTVSAERNVETLPLSPASPYAVSKLAGEYYAHLFAELYQLPTVSLRYFNVFGPRQSPESKYSAVIPIFVKTLMAGQAPVIHWDGEQSRDFTYVGNVVDANLAAATETGVELGGVYNIGNGENTSVNELLSSLQKLLGTNFTPSHTPKRAGDVLKTYADISKAQRDFGYHPQVSFKEGLALSIEWYRSHLQ